MYPNEDLLSGSGQLGPNDGGERTYRGARYQCQLLLYLHLLGLDVIELPPTSLREPIKSSYKFLVIGGNQTPAASLSTDVGYDVRYTVFGAQRNIDGVLRHASELQSRPPNGFPPPFARIVLHHFPGLSSGALVL